PALPDSIYFENVPFEPWQEQIAATLESGMPGRRAVARRTTFRPDFAIEPSPDGRLELRTDAIVAKVDYDPNTRRARGVTYIDAQSGRTREVRGKLVVLCASAIETARLLFNSSTPEYRDGLGNTS